MLQHRIAFPLVRYTGRYTIRFESEISTGGGGLPKRPHVHVYEGKVRSDHKVFIAAFWIEPEVEEKARGRNVTDVEVQDAKKAVEQYLTIAMTKWCRHFVPYFEAWRNPKPKIVDFYCADQPRVVVLCPGRYLMVQYCQQAYAFWFKNIPEFQNATDAELRNVTAPDPTSPWLHWSDLDADIFLDDDE